MVQPANKRLVTEATVGAHVANQITTPGTPTATALNATIATKVDPVNAAVAKSRRIATSALVQGMLTAPVMATPPTLTYSASAFAGYVAGATNATTGWPNNTAVRPSGAPLAPPNEFSATYPLGPDSQLTIFDGSVHFDFDCPDATFVFRTQLTATGKFRIWADGKPHAAAPVALTTLGAASGSPGYIKVDFGSRADARRVSIELEGVTPNATGTPLPFYGIWKEATGSIWPTSISSARMVVLGDSYAKGIGATYAADAYPVQLGKLLGITDVLHFTAVSSTGIMKGTTTNSYRTRLQKIIDAKPDIVLFQGSINDADAWPTFQGQIGPQFKLDIATLRAGLPEALIIVTSPLEVRTATAAEIAVRDELKTAVAEVGLPFIDILGTQFFSGTGKVGATNGTGNADFYVAPAALDSSGAHPSSAGHLALAKLLAGKIAPLIGATAA